jgi:hypothetical protein
LIPSAGAPAPVTSALQFKKIQEYLMANLLDWNTLDHKVKAYIDAENGIDSEQKAFPILMVAALLDVSDEEAEDSITDGSKDRGVDAIYVDDRDGANLRWTQSVGQPDGVPKL